MLTAQRRRRSGPDTARLHRTLDSLAAAHHGVVGYAVRDLDGGARLSLRGDETFPTASLIKVAVLVTLYDLAEHGQISLDDPVTLLSIDKVGGSGVLYNLHSGLTLSVRDAAQLMIELSDNTATNLLIEKITLGRVAAKMDSLGLRAHARAPRGDAAASTRASRATVRRSTGSGRRRPTRWRSSSRCWRRGRP